jgi:SAM-dependent methyltransferase
MTALGLLLGLRLPLKPLLDAKQDWSRRGLGCSDNAVLAATLASKFDYTNTYYHRFPRFDLTDAPSELRGALEFISCSDVLEHIPPPIEPALSGLVEVLRPGGFAFISVPVGDVSRTREYYPGLRTWKVVDNSVVWTDMEGAQHIDKSPEFHGGQGQTLAFRRWGERDLIGSLKTAGFSLVWSTLPDHPELGVPKIHRSGAFIARLADRPTEETDLSSGLLHTERLAPASRAP